MGCIKRNIFYRKKTSVEQHQQPTPQAPTSITTKEEEDPKESVCTRERQNKRRTKRTKKHINKKVHQPSTEHKKRD